MALKIILCLIFGYLFGSLNFAIIYSKLKGDDIRNHGSGNAGATNVLRTYGKGPAAVVFLLDILKGVIAVIIARLILNDAIYECSAALGAVLGHNFPVYYKFKGGKGFLVCLSTMYVIDWRVGLIATGIMIILLLITKYMSLSTTLAMLLCPILLIPFGASVPVILMALACTVFMAVRHKENFKRLIQGKESKFTLKSKK